MTEQFEIKPHEATQGAISMALSAFNGVFALAGAMAGRGFFTKEDITYFHEVMLQPLTNQGGSPELMALQAKRIDELCATLVMAIDKLQG